MPGEARATVAKVKHDGISFTPPGSLDLHASLDKAVVVECGWSRTGEAVQLKWGGHLVLSEAALI